MVLRSSGLNGFIVFGVHVVRNIQNKELGCWNIRASRKMMDILYALLEIKETVCIPTD